MCVSVNLQKMNIYMLSNWLFQIRSETGINQSPHFQRIWSTTRKIHHKSLKNHSCFTGNKLASFVYYLDLTPS